MPKMCPNNLNSIRGKSDNILNTKHYFRVVCTRICETQQPQNWLIIYALRWHSLLMLVKTFLMSRSRLRWQHLSWQKLQSTCSNHLCHQGTKFIDGDVLFKYHRWSCILFLFVEQLDQLELCIPYFRLLTGIPLLAVFKNLRWNSNKTSRVIL